MDAIWNWLIGEAGAAWIVGLAGLIWGLYHWNKSRQSSKHIILEETKRFSLLDIHPTLENNLNVFYTTRVGEAPQQIRTLHQTEFSVYNSGRSDFTEPFEFTVEFYLSKDRESAGVDGYWEMLFDDENRADCECLEGTDSSIGCTIQLKALNSWPKEKDYIRGYVVSEEPIYLSTNYQGLGWSTEYRDTTRRSERQTIRILNTIGLASYLGTWAVLWVVLDLEVVEWEPFLLVLAGSSITCMILVSILANSLMSSRISDDIIRFFSSSPYYD